MKQHVDRRADVRRTLTTVLIIRMAVVTVQRVTQQTAVDIVRMTVAQERVPAALGTLVAQVLTILTLATVPMLLVTAPELTAQLVAARHRAEVSTIRLTVTPSQDAHGRQLSP